MNAAIPIFLESGRSMEVEVAGGIAETGFDSRLRAKRSVAREPGLGKRRGSRIRWIDGP